MKTKSNESKPRKIYNWFYLLTLAFLLFFPKINFVNFSNITAGIRIEDILILISFLIYLYHKFIIRKERKILLGNKIEKYFYLYMGVCFISNIIGILNGYISLFTSFIYLIRKFEYFVLFYVGYDLFKDKNEKFFKIFDFVVIYHFIVLLLQMNGLVGGFRYGDITHAFSGRYFSVFNGPYELSAILLLILPYYVYNLINKKNIPKNILFLVLILLSICLTQSRTSILLYFVCLIIMFMFVGDFSRKTRKMIFITCIGLSLLFVIGGFWRYIPRVDSLNLKSIYNSILYSWEHKSIDLYQENISLIPLYPYGDLSFNIRIRFWMSLIDGFMKNPVFGMGLSIVKNSADGAYIRLLVESGIIGFSIWMMLCIHILKKFNGKSVIDCFIRYSWIMLLLGAIFIDLFDASRVMLLYWFFLGIATKWKEQNEENNRSSKIKVLEVIAELERGGAETLLVNILSNIDLKKFQINFLCYGDKQFDYEKVIKKYNSQIFRLYPPYQIGMKRHIKEVKEFLQKEHYDVVHVHNLFNCGPVLFAAYLAKVKIRIAHSHNTDYLDEGKISFKKKIYYILAKLLLNVFSTQKLACGKQAGKFLYYPWCHFQVIKNGIPSEKYEFNESVQKEYRKNFHIADDTLVLGHVGRFTEQKNHKGLIEIYSKILEKRSNCLLVLIGKGEKEEEIKKQVKKMKIEKKVLFLGVREDVNNLYNMMDVFIFPSLYEGLPFTIVEAQCNGLPVYLSNTITKEVDMTGLLHFISNDNIEEWVTKIISEKPVQKHAKSVQKIIDNGYDITTTVKEIEKIYEGDSL